MANPIIKIKNGNITMLYANGVDAQSSGGGEYLQSLKDGELAYNAWNNGLYIGYGGTNHLLSVANDQNKFVGSQTFYGTATNASVAASLGGTTVGSSSKPIYLSAGLPIECGNSLDVDISGNAATATTWQTARNFSISGTASDTTTYSVDGTKNITLTLPKTLSGFTSLSAATFTGGVWNGTTVAIDYGGTGMTTNPSMLVNLGSTTADNVFKASPRPGITGTLPVANGGTGATTFSTGQALIGNGTNAVSTRAITNNTTATAVSASTNLITANTLYYHKGNSNITTVGTISSGVWNGTTIAVSYGGTGNTSQTANRLIYSETASKLSSSGHYASSSKIAINSTSAPTETLYVNGSSKIVGNIAVDTGIISIVQDGNPYISLSDGKNTWYYQAFKNKDKVGLGSAWATATTWDVDGNVSIPASLSVTNDLSVSGEATIAGLITGSGGLYVSGHVVNSGDDEGIVVAPAANGYAGITLGSASGIRTTLYLLPEGHSHRSVWRCNNGSSSYDITHPETSGEVVVHTADTAQGSATLPVYVAASGVVTPCTASSVFSDFSSTAGASGETLSITVAGQTRTVTLDAANASQGGVITTGTQTIAGQKTFNGTIYSSKIAPRSDMNTDYLLGDTSNTWYNIYSRSLSLYDGINGKSGGQIYTAVSNATIAQTTVVELGNSTATGTAGNRYGVLRLYNEGSTYLNLVSYRYATDSTTTAATSRTVYLRDHGATAYLAATTTRSAVGSEVQPVYVTNSGVLTACKMTTSGKWFNALPVILSDGVMEVGRYIDFHSTNAITSDYSIRIDAGTGSQSNTLYLPDLSGQVVIHTNDTVEGSASLPVYIAASGKATACTASSVFSAFTSSTNTLSITVTGQTRTASIVNSISNTWTGGTTSGPTLKTIVNGVAGTAVAIPSASSSASGIVTTRAQTFAGQKTFSTGITMSAAKQIQRAGGTTSWYLGRSVALIKTTSYSGYDAIASMKTTDGDWSLGVYTNNIFYFTYVTDTNFNAGTNATTAQMCFYPNGTFHSPLLATGNTGTANPSGTPIVGTLYFKQI